MSGTLPLIMTASGPVAATPAAINATLLQNATALSPNLTTDLPASMVEDISSTATGALIQLEQGRVDAVDSITPYGANAFILAQQGVMLGLPQGTSTNTSVYVVISGPAGYVVPAGFIVSDGTYQYVVQEGGAIATGGSTSSLYAVANQSGTWAVPANTVTTIVTSVPSGYTLTVTNPAAGTPSSGTETISAYRARILQATTVTGQGTAAYIKTQLAKIPGVVPRLISVLQVSGGWEVICGGGDPYQVAAAIYASALNLNSIVGSTTTARNITVTITDPPNTYSVVFVNPPQQTVTATVTWNTTQTNFTAVAQVNQLAATALVSYFNSIPVGQPINELEMTQVFQNAVSSVLASEYLTTLTFSVSVNGTVTPPNSGTSIIPGDAESYWYCAATGVTVAQG